MNKPEWYLHKTDLTRRYFIWHRHGYEGRPWTSHYPCWQNQPYTSTNEINCEICHKVPPKEMLVAVALMNMGK